MRKSTAARLLLVLSGVLRLDMGDGRVGHDIPGIIDAHEQQQQRDRRGDEEAGARDHLFSDRRRAMVGNDSTCCAVFLQR